MNIKKQTSIDVGFIKQCSGLLNRHSESGTFLDHVNSVIREC